MSSKTFVNINQKYDRLVALIDMDCFYCQVEEKLNPELRGKPLAVVQYNTWKGGGIIAVNYPARARGVTRHMRGDEAQTHCPEIELVPVPAVREKADLTKYRDAGKQVADVLQRYANILERASVDEAYLDITERVVETMKLMDEGKYRLLPEKLANTYATGYDTVGDFVQSLTNPGDNEEDNDWDDCKEDIVVYKKSDIKLLIAAALVNEVRAAVKQETGYECSAGIAHNKILAKLACGMNKPNKQTLLPLKKIPGILATLPIGSIKGLGGKFGENVVEKLKIKYVGEMRQYTEKDMQKHFEEKNGSWLYLLCRGIDLEVVTPRIVSKSIGCCKKFPGRNAITGVTTLNHWFGELAKEIMERLEKDEIENRRRAKQITVSFSQQIGSEDVSSTRSIPLKSYDAEVIALDAFDTIKRNTEQFFKPDSNTVLNNPIKFVGISVGKFESNVESQKSKLQELFNNHTKKREAQPVLDHGETATVSSMPMKKNDNTIATFFKRKSDEVLGSMIIPEASDKIIESPPPVPLEKLDPKRSFFQKYLQTSKPIEPHSPAVEASHPNVIAAEAEGDTDSCPVDLNDSPITVLPEPIPATSSLPEISEPVKSDYKTSYIEFYRPPIEEAATVKCEKCAKNVLDFEYPSHLDYHFAFELSQQQRTEFRNEMLNKVQQIPAQSPPPNKKLKLIKTNSSNSIDKFLVPQSSQSQHLKVTVEETEGRECCEECNKFIKIDELLEHADYHTAKRLQDELSGVSYSTTAIKSSNANKVPKQNGKKKENSVLSYFKKPVNN